MTLITVSLNRNCLVSPRPKGDIIFCFHNILFLFFMALFQQVIAKSMNWTKISNGIIQHYYNIHMYLFTWFIVHFSFVKNIVILCIFVFKSLISKMCRFMELCRFVNDVTIECLCQFCSRCSFLLQVFFQRKPNILYMCQMSNVFYEGWYILKD